MRAQNRARRVIWRVIKPPISGARGDAPSPRASRRHERFRLSGPSAQVFDEGISSAGAVVTGRRTYDIANGWNGEGLVPGLPMFVRYRVVRGS
jgi:hypothetical protein